jgi:hypothetical protein
MKRIMVAISFVIVTTLIGGVLGGFVGQEIGKLSPEFVATIAYGTPDRAHPNFRPDRFGLGVGAAAGLFFGAGSSVVLVLANVGREVWLARAASKKGQSEFADLR